MSRAADTLAAMMSMSARTRTALFGGAVALAAIAQLLVGFLYLVSGLAVPGYALIPLWLWWGLLTALMIRWALQRSWWAVAVPLVAFLTWQVVVLLGGELLGWTA